MMFDKKKKEEKKFILKAPFPEGFEAFVKDNYTKQQALDLEIGKAAAKEPIKLTNFMVRDDLHKLFVARYFVAKPLEDVVMHHYQSKKGEDCKQGTTFYYMYYGFTFYDPKSIRKIALNFLPNMKLIPFAIHGQESTDGVLCLDYRENESQPSILYINAETNDMITVTKTFGELIR